MVLHLQLGLIFDLRPCDFSNALLLMVNALFVVANVMVKRLSVFVLMVAR